MTAPMHVFLSRSLLVLLVISVAVAHSRPSHFGENNQLVSDQEMPNNVVESNLKPLLNELWAQRLAELRNNQDDMEFGIQRQIRSGNDIKRQSRYRLCYFNPVSCFKK